MSASGPASAPERTPTGGDRHRREAALALIAVPVVLALAAALEIAGAAPLWVMALPPCAVVVGLLAAGLVPRGPGAALPAWAAGAALAADQMPPAVLLAGTSAVYAAGFDGLPVALAGAGGVALATILVAPPLRRLDADDVPSAFAARFDATQERSQGARFAVLCARAVTVLTGVVLVAGALGGGSALLARFTGLAPVAALLGLTLAVLALALTAGARSARWVGVGVCVALVIGIVAPLVVVATGRHGLPFPYLTFGQALEDLARLEFRLIRGGLIDFETFRAHATPFLSTSMTNVVALTAVLALGTTCLPPAPRYAGTAPNARVARRTFLWAAVVVVALATLLPAAAAYVKLVVEEMVAAGGGPAALPAWVFAAGRLGLLEICNVPALDVETITQACSARAGGAGRLRLHDVALARDAHLLALPIVTAMPAVVAGALFAAVAAVGLSAPAAVLRATTAGFAAAVPINSLTTTAATTTGTRSAAARGGVAAVLSALAAAGAWYGGIGFLEGLGWAASLAAGSLFAPLVLALWWRRASAWGVAAGLLSGAAVTIYYIVGTRFFAADFHEAWSHLQSVSPRALQDYAALRRAIVGTDGAAREAMIAALDVKAQALAGWWGLRNLAAGILGLPLAATVTVVVSLLTPPRRGAP